MRIFKIGKGGFVSQLVITPEGELTDLYVHPLFRGRGLAHKLLKRATSWADRNRLSLRLRIHPYGRRTVRSSRAPASFTALVELYKQYGFQRVNKDWMLRRK